MTTEFDVIVLGGGPGGYLASERLGHAGKKVLLVEEIALGGTCLNVGCIPTKTLLNSVKTYTHALEGDHFGVHAEGVTYSWERMQAWKAEVVKGLVAGVGMAEKKAGVTVLNARGTFEGPGRVTVEGTTYTAEHVILATGSVPVMPPIPGAADNPKVVDSTGILSLAEVPARLTVVGGGVIGVEFAALYAALGTEVTVIEMAAEITPFADAEVAAALRKALGKVTFEMGCKVESISDGAITYSKDGAAHTVDADVILMAVGRRPALQGWGAENTGLEMTPRGIVVDDRMRTNLPNVWAVGDCNGRSPLAHSAYRMGEVAAANILDPEAYRRGEVMRWNTVPWVVYTAPEMAGVGMTEASAVEAGHEIITAKAPALMSGRFIAENGFRAPGFAKVIADKHTRQILGVHVLGAYASEMIWGAQAMLETELTIEDARQLVFPHPTVSEVIREALWAF
ncbi:dihydrolipoyl dehydrogenase [Schaalia sp. Marseille-Q2122]|uniref:dihydrolipoyl dehydrogenase n=1 Tax=Schaalia sp. Marseille-Q2122 TaxID=2736604 RepID=UPI00158F23E2|nr:dihydrolipoyl dehydrogenase [Schaalia sp. Marseille-Q2122]